nr:hypothetical protein [Tanacetum cinerariifolium]
DREFSVSLVRNYIDDKILGTVSSKTQWCKFVPIKDMLGSWSIRTTIPEIIFLSTIPGEHLSLTLVTYLLPYLFTRWSNLRIVISVDDKLEQPISPAPIPAQADQQVAPEALAAHAAWVRGSKEIAGLMLMTIEPEIQRNLENLGAYEMLEELKTMFSQQNYNMHGMGKTVNEFAAMLKLHEQTLPKKDAPALHVIRAGKGLWESSKLKPGALSLYVGNDNAISVSRNNLVYFYVVPRDGIFEIDLSNSNTNDSSMYAVINKRAKVNLDSALLWHCRLEYISKKRIEKLQHDELLNSTDLKAFEKCVSPRNVRLGLAADGFNPFRNLSQSYSIPKSLGKDIDVYFRSLIDDLKDLWEKTGIKTIDVTTSQKFNMRARVLWTINDFLLKVVCLGGVGKVFKNEVENQAGKTIKALRSDHGGEYISQEFKDYLTACEIVQQRTPPYTPQHNGVSERRNQTAACILNMVQTKKVDKTPYELRHGKVPNLSYLKVWGCEAHVKRHTADKLEQRSVNQEFKDYLKACGIVQQLTPPYTPQHNGVSERRNQIVLDQLYFNVEVEEHSLGDKGEPISYKAALSDPKFKKWLVAMNAEIQSMYDNKVWKLVDLPPGAKVVKSKWICKKKTDMDGVVYIYKACLVAKGFTQTYGVDYEETFSPIADIRAIRILIAIAAYYDYKIYLKEVKDYIGKCFSMKDLGYATYILGIKIYRDRSRRLIGLSQDAYLDKILKRYRIDGSKRGAIPMQDDCHLDKSQCVKSKDDKARMHNVLYASAVGSIMYDVRCTRPDVVFAQNHKPISAESCCKSSDVDKEVFEMNCDNTAAISIAKEPGIMKGARHFQRKFHYVHECVETGKIEMVKVHTDDNLPDLFTKALAGPKLTRHARSMCIRPASSYM